MKYFVAMLFIGLSSQARADYKLGLNIGFSPNYTINTTGTTTSNGTSVNVDVTIDFDSSMEFGLDYWNSTQNSWGLISGVSTTPERKSKTVKAAGISVPMTDLKISSTFLYVGAHYRWQSFYIPLGITYSINRISTNSNTNGDLKVKNGIGALIGIGWFIDDRFAIDLLGKSSVVDLESSENGVSSTDKGTIATGTFSLRYFF